MPHLLLSAHLFTPAVAAATCWLRCNPTVPCSAGLLISYFLSGCFATSTWDASRNALSHSDLSKRGKVRELISHVTSFDQEGVGTNGKISLLSFLERITLRYNLSHPHRWSHHSPITLGPITVQVQVSKAWAPLAWHSFLPCLTLPKIDYPHTSLHALLFVESSNCA